MKTLRTMRKTFPVKPLKLFTLCLCIPVFCYADTKNTTIDIIVSSLYGFGIGLRNKECSVLKHRVLAGFFLKKGNFLIHDEYLFSLGYEPSVLVKKIQANVSIAAIFPVAQRISVSCPGKHSVPESTAPYITEQPWIDDSSQNSIFLEKLEPERPFVTHATSISLGFSFMVSNILRYFSFQAEPLITYDVIWNNREYEDYGGYIHSDINNCE